VRCIVVTNDLPLTIRLTQRQIEFISLDESLLLPSDPDPLEKKNKQLEGELLRYKSREPDLAIKFEDGENYVRFRLGSPTNTPDRSRISKRSWQQPRRSANPSNSHRSLSQ
jgi:hypothetical protein